LLLSKYQSGPARSTLPSRSVSVSPPLTSGRTALLLQRSCPHLAPFSYHEQPTSNFHVSNVIPICEAGFQLLHPTLETCKGGGLHGSDAQQTYRNEYCKLYGPETNLFRCSSSLSKAYRCGCNLHRWRMRIFAPRMSDLVISYKISALLLWKDANATCLAEDAASTYPTSLLGRPCCCCYN
jgi:hypothetical protein